MFSPESKSTTVQPFTSLFENRLQQPFLVRPRVRKVSNLMLGSVRLQPMAISARIRDSTSSFGLRNALLLGFRLNESRQQKDV